MLFGAAFLEASQANMCAIAFTKLVEKSARVAEVKEATNKIVLVALAGSRAGFG